MNELLSAVSYHEKGQVFTCPLEPVHIGIHARLFVKFCLVTDKIMPENPYIHPMWTGSKFILFQWK